MVEGYRPRNGDVMVSLSVVVPMYNESAEIIACLRALVEQSQPLHEIIVVDNGSTDGSQELVRSFASEFPVVKLLSETEQGCYAARATGYDASSGDVICRTDADTIVGPRWAEAIARFFESSVGREFAAVTGPINLADAPDFAIMRMATKVPESGLETTVFAGPNHALRRDAWIEIRDSLLRRVDIWEDFDISLSLQERGLKIYFEPAMTVETSMRMVVKSPIQNYHYLTGGIRTAAARGNTAATRRMKLDLPIRFMFAGGAWFLCRPWDPATQDWRLSRLFKPLDHMRHDVTRPH